MRRFSRVLRSARGEPVEPRARGLAAASLLALAATTLLPLIPSVALPQAGQSRGSVALPQAGQSRGSVALPQAGQSRGTVAGPQAGQVAPTPGPPRVVTVKIDGAISGGTVEILDAALALAREQGASAVAITLDTPGGQLDATRDIVKAMLASDVPTLVWVGPAGAHAASAGTFITMAANVAAMDPASNIGAAHPVDASGKDIAGDMKKKVENDTAALVRFIAAERGRNAAWAEKAVRESVSATAPEAVKLHVVDLVAPTLRDALDQADGRAVKTAAGTVTFRGRDAILVPFHPSVRERLIELLSNPNVVAVLMLLGTLGIAVEFYHPGAILPGAVGALCLLLAFLAMRVIPVNVGAVVLILAGVALLAAEAFVTAHGAAGVGGAALIVLGTMFFVDRSSPDYQFAPGAFRMSPWIVWPTPLALAAILGFMAWKIAAARRAPLQLGSPALVGARGEALSEIGPGGGEAFVHGEYWRARSDDAIPKGAPVRVVAVQGLVVTVVADAARTG